MLSKVKAMEVTSNCIKVVGGSFPSGPDDDLISLSIDNSLIDRLVNKIGNDNRVGLPSLNPKFKIDENIFAIDETSTVRDVATTVFQNAVPA